MTTVESTVAAARSQIEKTWDELVERREMKLQEVDELEREIRQLYPILSSLGAAA